MFSSASLYIVVKGWVRVSVLDKITLNLTQTLNERFENK
jgi:hypothetical protein